MTDISKVAYEQMEPYMDGHLSDCLFSSAPLDVCDCIQRRMFARIEQLTDERDRQYDQNAEFIVKIAELEAALAEAVQWNWIDHEEGAADPHSTSRIPEGIVGPIQALLIKDVNI